MRGEEVLRPGSSPLGQESVMADDIILMDSSRKGINDTWAKMGCSNQEVYKGLGPQIVRVEEGPAYLSHPSGVLRLVQQFQAQVIFLVPPFLLRDIGPKNKEEIR